MISLLEVCLEVSVCRVVLTYFHHSLPVPSVTVSGDFGTVSTTEAARVTAL